jgi:hypothetical protein
MVPSLNLDARWDQTVQHVAAKFAAEISRPLLTLLSSNHVLPTTFGVLLSRLRQDLGVSVCTDKVFPNEGPSEALWQTLRAFVHSYVRDVMVIEETNPVIKRLYHGFVRCFSGIASLTVREVKMTPAHDLHHQVTARDKVLHADLAHVPLLGLLPDQHELSDDFPMEFSSEELSAETISARFLRYIQHKTPARQGRGSLTASLPEFEPQIALTACMQQLVRGVCVMEAKFTCSSTRRPLATSRRRSQPS